MKKLALLSCLFLLACTKPETPAQAVYQAQVGYNAAATIAVKYIKLPRCTDTSPLLCSEPRVIVRVKQADSVAYNSIKSAQEAVRTPGFTESKVNLLTTSATKAVEAFSAITQELEIE